MALRLQKLDVSAIESDGGAPTSSDNEAMLDWLVVYVCCCWTPTEGMVCYLSIFGGLLFHVLRDVVEEG